MYNKSEAVESLYNTTTFDFDCALPNESVSNIIKELIERKRVNWYESTTNKTASDLWEIMNVGCVYADCRISGRSGFLPITNDALDILSLFNEMHNVNVIFTPIIKE
jgi:hypothetical protein